MKYTMDQLEKFLTQEKEAMDDSFESIFDMYAKDLTNNTEYDSEESFQHTLIFQILFGYAINSGFPKENFLVVLEDLKNMVEHLVEDE